MSIPVLTRAYSNGRGGANIEESVLTAAAVRSRGIKRLFSLQLAGDARGVEAQASNCRVGKPAIWCCSRQWQTRS